MSLLPASLWTAFHCEHGDFVVKSVPDDMSFAVNRAMMQSSEVFRDMFSLGETGAQENQAVDLHETSDVLIILLRLLHYPPHPPVLLPPDAVSEDALMSSRRPCDVYDPSTMIPLPILSSVLLDLVDKYSISNSITDTLHAHLIAHVTAYPLQVYAYAHSHQLERIASEASQYLMPIASYGTEDIKLISSVEAYHKVVRLQDLRVKELRSLVLSEDIFPHGYGTCPPHHKETNALWEAKRMHLACQIESVTDVAAEMNTLAEFLPKDCQTCHKAYIAAVKMLAYKSRRTLRRIDQIPP